MYNVFVYVQPFGVLEKLKIVFTIVVCVWFGFICVLDWVSVCAFVKFSLFFQDPFLFVCFCVCCWMMGYLTYGMWKREEKGKWELGFLQNMDWPRPGNNYWFVGIYENDQVVFMGTFRNDYILQPFKIHFCLFVFLFVAEWWYFWHMECSRYRKMRMVLPELLDFLCAKYGWKQLSNRQIIDQIVFLGIFRNDYI